MRTIRKCIPAIRANIDFIIGEHAAENFEAIDQANHTDIWFHVNGRPSCHVIAQIPQNHTYDKKQLHKIIVQGCVLCKQYSKYDNVSNLSIMYTPIKHVIKTNVVGSVTVEQYKTFVV